MAGNTSTPGATVTGRVLSILWAFDERHPRLTLSEIARRSGLAPATAHRLVGELTEHGALARQGSEYAVGRRLWEIGLLAPVQSSLREAASPFLHDIYAATRATVHLAIRDDDRVLYLERFSGRASVPVVSTVGSTLPMHATGVGKVLLAYAPEDVRRRVLGSLTRITPYTITHPGRLNEQLLRVRRDGYASTVEEMTLGACTVAVPVRRGETTVAAIGVVVPDLRRHRGRLVAALQVAAQGIGRQLESGAAAPPRAATGAAARVPPS
ncbi:IclR family transcriptional regulator [Nocardia implantans]|uniref:IclR family transcriptional regulator n=1 Tax=Nocardia implantans TaxID=3108168 RepID=A0ABU6B3K0_9NOCA|nr:MULTISPECIES: IclR family transcriptional regulator [unclassified Nocardia]MBF6195950.1 IclR family transcriptional regulator [Nocardia beijingensis]MEA3532314.1 IclR family transcriptional regulator [Nocardia sp. CDC192]MEB3514291.1 IclR family transcriptional regulator [Nocardia sp. CDC186]